MKILDAERMFLAMADATRLRILCLLLNGELCVCDLMSVLKEPQSKVSRHLGYLRRAGLVDARKQGLWMYYRLAKPAAKTFRAIFSALEHAEADIDQIGKDRSEYQKTKGCLVACCK